MTRPRPETIPAGRTVFPYLAGLMAMALLLISPSARGLAQPPRKRPATPVIVARAVEKMVSPSLELVGAAKANRTSKVAAEAGGLVKAVHFKEGDLVRSGDPLVDLDKTGMRLRLKAAQASLAGVMVKLEAAMSDLDRSSRLKERKTISQTNYEDDLFKVKALKQTAAQSQAEAARLAESVKRMTVRAPFTGYIVEKHTEVGQWLKAGACVAALMDLSLIKVRVPLPERYLDEIKVGERARVTFDALGQEVFTGRVTAVIPAADEKSHNLPVEVTLPNPEGRIKAGLLARATLIGSERKVLLVPKDALVLDRGRATVFVVNSETVSAVTVSVGRAHGRQVEISGQVKPDQKVVVQGNERLRPGQKVRIISTQAPDDSAPK